MGLRTLGKACESARRPQERKHFVRTLAERSAVLAVRQSTIFPPRADHRGRSDNTDTTRAGANAKAQPHGRETRIRTPTCAAREGKKVRWTGGVTGTRQKVRAASNERRARESNGVRAVSGPTGIVLTRAVAAPEENPVEKTATISDQAGP